MGNVVILFCMVLVQVEPDPIKGVVQSGQVSKLDLTSACKGTPLAIVIGLSDLPRLGQADGVEVRLRFEKQTLIKKLHLADPDVTWQIRPEAGSSLQIELAPDAENRVPINFRVSVAPMTEGDDGVAFEVEPNDSPELAQKISLGRTVYATADDRPEYPAGLVPTEAESSAGKDWFRFDFSGPEPRLAFFAIEFVDRDVPPDVRVYRRDDAGRMVEFLDGIDPQSLQRERPPRPGANKFTTRVLSKPGTYFLLVDACHPDYQLRTKLYPVPPYLKAGDETDSKKVADAARQAIRVAMDFQLLAGDSWHANTPRKGHAIDRVANPHQETSTCIACHPTHFTTQSVLAAEHQGYRIEEPFALKFLSERLYNNPIPLHGYPEAVWARMIPAPANVLGRLSTMMMDFENEVAGNQRNNTHRAIGQFLKLYYDGRTEIAPDETNGNNPISRYKVATDSWRQLSELVRRTNDPAYAETRNLVARLLVTGKPDNTRDLAAQTIGLCQVDPVRHRNLIAANVRHLVELQRPNGHWSPRFDPAYPHAAMQTGESLRALRLAGFKEDHPVIRKGLVALLKEQGSFGGWLDLSKYEQFQTPFRETQWALIALSSHYPGPGTQGWNGPLGKQPETLDRSSDSRLIADLERIWDEPDKTLISSIVESLTHPNVQVRLAACEALGRVGRGESIRPLTSALGDPSKLVRRSAAEAMRLLGNRRNGSHRPGETAEQVTLVKAICGALNSSDTLQRRAAARIFVAHFRELSQEHSLADLLLAILDDPDPLVRMGAVKGLWRFWYWQSDTALRGRIEDRLIAQLARTEHPWVRRNLIEALYIIGDENVRYLYKNWVPSLALKTTRDRVTAAQHETTARLVAKYVTVLNRGPREQKVGVLKAMSEFHERPGGQGRVGNDTEPMLVYDEAIPVLVKALIARLSDPDPEIRRLSLESLVTVRESKDPLIGLSVAALRADEDESVRDWAETMSKEFPLVIVKGKLDANMIAVIDRLLGSIRPSAKAAGLEIVGKLGPLPGASDRGSVVRDGLADPSSLIQAAALRALVAFPKIQPEGKVRDHVAVATQSSEPAVRAAAVRLALDHGGYVPDRLLRKALADDSIDHRLALLAAFGSRPADYQDLRLIGVLSASLDEEKGGVREKALQVIQAAPVLLNNAAIEQGLREVAASSNPRQKEIARALLASRGRFSGRDTDAELLDLAYFASKVQPIFNRMGEDGQNCVGCHRSHSILKLAPPDADGRWSTQATRSNYRATLRVVNLARPADSLLLAKPTWDAFEEAEAQNDPTKKAHAGGIRFESGKSVEYQTLLDWVNGARLTKETRADR